MHYQLDYQYNISTLSHKQQILKTMMNRSNNILCMYTGIILVAFLAIWLGMPHRQLDWNGEILPMAHEKMNLSTQTDTPLEDMIIVLTGSTSGIGLALTKTLVKLGAIVVALGRSETKLQALQESLPINVEPIVADFNDLDSVTRACDLIQERFQRIDVLINNAFIRKPS
jgi:NADPH:quinone reductase-like Zn-dependent oxidoreductase